MDLNNFESKEALIKIMNEKEECPHHYNLKSLDSCEDGINLNQCMECWSQAIDESKNNNMILFENKGLEVFGALAEVEKTYKELSQQRDDLKEKLLNMMEEHKINKFDNDYISITYVPAAKRESFNSKDFKSDYPELFKKYSKDSAVKSSVRFKIK